MIADGLRFVPTDNNQPSTSGIYYYHNNHLGTPQILTDENQQIVWQASYTPYGLAEISSELVINNIRLPRQYFDAETGLYYNYFRYYDPKIGRYMTSDPIGLDGGINTFGYVGGNPIGFVDLFGLCRNMGENVEACRERMTKEHQNCMDNRYSICNSFILTKYGETICRTLYYGEVDKVVGTVRCNNKYNTSSCNWKADCDGNVPKLDPVPEQCPIPPSTSNPHPILAPKYKYRPLNYDPYKN